MTPEETQKMADRERIGLERQGLLMPLEEAIAIVLDWAREHMIEYDFLTPKNKQALNVVAAYLDRKIKDSSC